MSDLGYTALVKLLRHRTTPRDIREAIRASSYQIQDDDVDRIVTAFSSDDSLVYDSSLAEAIWRSTGADPGDARRNAANLYLASSAMFLLTLRADAVDAHEWLAATAASTDATLRLDDTVRGCLSTYAYNIYASWPRFCPGDRLRPLTVPLGLLLMLFVCRHFTATAWGDASQDRVNRLLTKRIAEFGAAANTRRWRLILGSARHKFASGARENTVWSALLR